MSTTSPAGISKRNVRLTIQKQIRDNFEMLLAYGGKYVGHVLYGDKLSDPTGLDERLAKLNYWVEMQILAHGIGQGKATLVQFDCVQGVYPNTSGSYAGDEFGDELEQMVSDLCSTWTPSNVGFFILDFDNALTPTNNWMLVKNSLGKQGHEDSISPTIVEAGIIRQVVRYWMWSSVDMAPAQQYYRDGIAPPAPTPIGPVIDGFAVRNAQDGILSGLDTSAVGLGDLVYFSGNNAVAKVNDVIGPLVFAGVSEGLPGQIRIAGAAIVNMVSGLSGADTPAAGKLVFLSAIAGKGTTHEAAPGDNVEDQPVGQIIDASKYTSNGICLVLIQQPNLVRV